MTGKACGTPLTTRYDGQANQATCSVSTKRFAKEEGTGTGKAARGASKCRSCLCKRTTTTVRPFPRTAFRRVVSCQLKTDTSFLTTSQPHVHGYRKQAARPLRAVLFAVRNRSQRGFTRLAVLSVRRPGKRKQNSVRRVLFVVPQAMRAGSGTCLGFRV